MTAKPAAARAVAGLSKPQARAVLHTAEAGLISRFGCSLYPYATLSALIRKEIVLEYPRRGFQVALTALGVQVAGKLRPGIACVDPDQFLRNRLGRRMEHAARELSEFAPEARRQIFERANLLAGGGA